MKTHLFTGTWLYLRRKSPKPAKEGKKPRKWDLSGNTKDLVDLDRTKDKPQEDHEIQADTHVSNFTALKSCKSVQPVGGEKLLYFN